MKDAFTAEYFNFRPVKSRKVLQIILEVDESQFDSVYQLLGFPKHGTRVGVTLMREDVV